MKNILVLLLSSILFISCKSINLPTVEQSEENIARLKPMIESAEKAVDARNILMPSGNDVVMRVKLDAMNEILGQIAKDREDDITINFLPTRPFMSEDKSVLGISYKNYINIDSGYVGMNLKKLVIDRLSRNSIDAKIEVEGKGNLKVSGKYTGIPASANPEISLYLNEPVSFEIQPTLSGSAVLKPRPRKLTLKTKFNIKLLEWKVPWYQEIPLEFSNILKPIAIPIALSSEVNLPMPASKFGSGNTQNVPYKIELLNPSVKADDNKLEYRADIRLNRK